MFSFKKFLLLIIVAGGVWLWWHTRSDIEVALVEKPIVGMAVPEVVETDEEISEIVDEETEIRTVEAPERFFYSQLDERQQEIYRQLRDGVARSDEEIQIETDNGQEVHDIYRLILFDYPEFFWITGASSTTVYQWSDGRTYIVFVPEYGHTGTDKERMQAAIDEVVEAFLGDVDPALSEYEVVRAVYEYIILTTMYNLDAPDHQNIYSVFVNRESVCAGFSRAAQLLLNRLGIFATYVTGFAYVPGVSDAPVPHAWNLVRVYGEYYYLDVTWGSPNFQDGSELGHSGIVYDYLLVNEEKLFRTHTPAEGLVLPVVTSLRHNFFVMNGMFYDVADEERVLEAMNESIQNQEDWVAFKFATPELFQEMRSIILEDLAPQAARNLASWYGLESVQYFIREKENLNKITIYWFYE